MMASRFTVLHHASLVAPLGFRFWDAVTQTAVRDGLRVLVARKDNPAQTYPAFPNSSGIYVVRGLPGLRTFEHGLLPDGNVAQDAEAFWKAWQAEWNATPPRKLISLVVTVTDLQGRFLPAKFEAQAPTKGVFSLACGILSPLPPLSPLQPMLPHVPLFSAPGRQAPANCAAIYADLKVGPTSVSAAWAWIEASYNGKLIARGMSDRLGRAALLMAYPEVNMRSVALGSPLGSPIGSAIPLDAQNWQIDITAGYTSLVPDAQGKLPEPVDIPDLCTALKQPAISNPTRETLFYGQPCVVRSKVGTQHLSVWQIAPT